MAAMLLIIFVVYFQLTDSQYYGQSASISYQPYFCSPIPTPPVTQPMYAAPAFSPSTYPPPSYPQPTLVSPTPTYASTSPTLPTFPPSTFTPPSPAIPTFEPATFTKSSTARPTFALSALPAIPPYPPTFSQEPTYSLPTYASAPTFAPVALSKYHTPPTPMFAPVGSATPKCSPPTATAYYLTTALQAPKAADMKKKVKETLLEKPLEPPTYPCPFCTGFANVPKNPKISPPPPCSTVLPGMLDKIPTIAMPDELKLKDLSKTPALFSDLFEHKLSGKLRFDEDLLDGFLTGLGLGNCKD